MEFMKENYQPTSIDDILGLQHMRIYCEQLAVAGGMLTLCIKLLDILSNLGDLAFDGISLGISTGQI